MESEAGVGGRQSLFLAVARPLLPVVRFQDVGETFVAAKSRGLLVQALQPSKRIIPHLGRGGETSLKQKRASESNAATVPHLEFSRTAKPLVRTVGFEFRPSCANKVGLFESVAESRAEFVGKRKPRSCFVDVARQSTAIRQIRQCSCESPAGIIILNDALQDASGFGYLPAAEPNSPQVFEEGGSLAGLRVCLD